MQHKVEVSGVNTAKLRVLKNEETQQLLRQAREGDAAAREEEMGDLLLTVTSLCRKLKIDPEVALNRATDKFIDRFDVVETAVLSQGKEMDQVDLGELNRIWDEIKHKKAEKN